MAKDEDKKDESKDDDLNFDGSEGTEVLDPEGKKTPDRPLKEKIEVEIADDTPEEDKRVLEARKRKDKKLDPEEADLGPLPDKEDDLDKEIAEYGKRSQKRIKQLYSRFHDERRAKDQAQRSHEEAVRFAEKVYAENKKLAETISKGETFLVEKIKEKAALSLEAAKKKYKEAFDAGDGEAIAKATEEMSAAVAEKREAESFKPREPLQPEKKGVQDDRSTESDASARRTEQQQRQTPPDPKAVTWANDNKWFGTDEEMTAYAYGLHQKLVLRENFDPRSDEYYERINKEVRKRFPEKFEKPAPAEGERPRSPAPSKTVVAGVTRAPASKKVTLTATQAALAKRLGVPLELYAEQVLKESGNA